MAKLRLHSVASKILPNLPLNATELTNSQRWAEEFPHWISWYVARARTYRTSTSSAADPVPFWRVPDLPRWMSHSCVKFTRTTKEIWHDIRVAKMVRVEGGIIKQNDTTRDNTTKGGCTCDASKTTNEINTKESYSRRRVSCDTKESYTLMIIISEWCDCVYLFTYYFSCAARNRVLLVQVHIIEKVSINIMVQCTMRQISIIYLAWYYYMSISGLRSRCT